MTEGNVSYASLSQIRSGDLRSILVDDSSGALLTVDYAHHEVHEGDSYHVSDVQEVDTTTMYWMITT